MYELKSQYKYISQMLHILKSLQQRNRSQDIVPDRVDRTGYRGITNEIVVRTVVYDNSLAR